MNLRRRAWTLQNGMETVQVPRATARPCQSFSTRCEQKIKANYGTEDGCIGLVGFAAGKNLALGALPRQRCSNCSSVTAHYLPRMKVGEERRPHTHWHCHCHPRWHLLLSFFSSFVTLKPTGDGEGDLDSPQKRLSRPFTLLPLDSTHSQMKWAAK